MLLGAAASAHQATLSYSQIEVNASEVAWTVAIADRDLPADPDLSRYVIDRLGVTSEGRRCTPSPRPIATVTKTGGLFSEVPIVFDCHRRVHEVTLHYDLLFDLDALHQSVVSATVDGKNQQAVFRSSSRTLLLGRPAQLWHHLRDYFLLGVEHIFTGTDHLAFLFALLLAIDFDNWRRGARSVLWIVTAFTAAHTLTLMMSGLGLFSLSPRLVEPAIALSILYVAIENMVHPPRGRWLLTFLFGLVHGLGFASALRDIGLPPRGVIPSLIAFNVGVECGQLTVVTLAMFPLLLAARRFGSTRLRLFGSLLLAILAAWWLLERVQIR